MDLVSEIKKRFDLQKEFLGLNKKVNRIEPMVSVSVITYQHVNFIRECLDGILMQKTNFPFEIIIGEDGSTDGTREICIEYAKKYPNLIRLFLRDRNVSHLTNEDGNDIILNGKFQKLHARGKYYAPCEGDDYWTDPYKLQKQVDFLESNPEYVLSFTNCDIMDEPTNSISKDAIKYKQTTFDHQDMPIYASTLTRLYRAELFANPPDSYLKAPGGDTYQLVYISRFGKIKFQNFNSAVYRRHKNGLWSSKNEIEKLFHLFDTRFALLDIIDEQLKKKFYALLKDLLDQIKDKNKSKEETEIFNNKLFSFRKKIVESGSEYFQSEYKSLLVSFTENESRAQLNLNNSSSNGNKFKKTHTDNSNTRLFSEYLLGKGWQYKFILYKRIFESYSELKKVNKPAISIIVISWRLHPDTIKNFEILEKQRDQNFELIFVNNGGSENEFDVLNPFIDKYIKLNSNTGAYLARNIGSLFAVAPILLFLEDDGIPEDNLISEHLNLFAEYDIIACRGLYIPKTNNPLNKKQDWYYVGDKEYPTFAHIEGNTSYLAEPFFNVGGWDDEIKFGGGGLELYFRLLNIEPDIRKQIYSPKPIIYHDFVSDQSHLKTKLENQNKSFDILRKKYPQWDEVTKNFKKYSGRGDLLISKKNHTPIKKNIQTIVFFTHYTDLYGANRSLIKLIEEFITVGYNIIVFIPNYGKITDYFSQNDITHFIVPFPWAFSEQVEDKNIFQSRFRNTIKSLKPIVENCILYNVDLIYSNTSVIDIGLITAKIIEKPHIWHIREFGDLDYNIYPDVGAKVYSKLLKSSDGIIFISNSLKEYFNDKYDVQGEVVHNGILSKTELEYLTKLPKVNNSKKEFNFLIAGYVRESKGQNQAVMALSNIISKHPNVTLTVIGSGDIKWLEDLVNSLSLQENVRILGDAANPNEYYLESDVFLMCSENEAFGRVTLESMACGTTVIGRNSGGTKEIIKDGYNGLLYNGTVQDLTEKMLFTIENPNELKRLNKNGIETVREQFTTDVYASKISNYINSFTKSNLSLNGIIFDIGESKLSSIEEEMLKNYWEFFMLKSNKQMKPIRATVMENNNNNISNQNLDELLVEAEDLIQTGSYDKAVEKLTSMLEIDHNNIDALNDLSVIKILKEDFEESKNILELILEIDPNNEIALENMNYLNSNYLKKNIINNQTLNTPNTNNESNNDLELLQLQKNWNSFGEKDPMWAILTDPNKKDNGWQPGEFFETGINEIDRILVYLERINIKLHFNRALDFGCGIGRLTQALSLKFNEVSGIDIAPSMIEKANYYNRFKAKCKYYLNSKNDLSLFSNNYFDFIYTIITLQHMKPKYSKNFLNEFIRVLKPGGIIVFQLPSKKLNQVIEVSKKDENDMIQSFNPDEPIMEMHGICKEEVLQIIDKVGADVIEVVPDKSLGEEWESYRYCVQKRQYGLLQKENQIEETKNIY